MSYRVFTDKTARMRIGESYYGLKATVAELRYKLAKAEQVVRLAKEFGLKQIAGKDIRVDTVLYLQYGTSTIFPGLMYKVTKRVKSRKENEWHIHISPVGHEDPRSGLTVTGGVFYWTGALVCSQRTQD